MRQLEASGIVKEIVSPLPCDDPAKSLQTMIAWWGYAGRMVFNTKTGVAFVPKGDDSADKVA